MISSGRLQVDISCASELMDLKAGVGWPGATPILFMDINICWYLLNFKDPLQNFQEP